MRNPHEAGIMLKALEERLRNIAANDPERLQLEKCRTEALNMQSRATSGQWIGWEAKE